MTTVDLLDVRVRKRHAVDESHTAQVVVYTHSEPPGRKEPLINGAQRSRKPIITN